MDRAYVNRRLPIIKHKECDNVSPPALVTHDISRQYSKRRQDKAVLLPFCVHRDVSGTKKIGYFQTMFQNAGKRKDQMDFTL